MTRTYLLHRQGYYWPLPNHGSVSGFRRPFTSTSGEAESRHAKPHYDVAGDKQSLVAQNCHLPTISNNHSHYTPSTTLFFVATHVSLHRRQRTETAAIFALTPITGSRSSRRSTSCERLLCRTLFASMILGKSGTRLQFGFTDTITSETRKLYELTLSRLTSSVWSLTSQSQFTLFTYANSTAGSRRQEYCAFGGRLAWYQHRIPMRHRESSVTSTEKRLLK